MEPEIIHLANQEGISYAIPLKFIGKETNIGDKHISYQLLRLKRSGLFSIDELYTIATLIQVKQPDSLINWTETFMMLESDNRQVTKKLKALHLV
jgi:hypothetical protein